MLYVYYDNHQFTYYNEKFSLNEIYRFLKYKLFEEDIYVTKDELLKFLDEDYEEDRKFIHFLKNDFVEPIMDIYTFMTNNDLNFLLNEVFEELWFSLVNKKNILITPNLLNFIYHPSNNKKKNFSVLFHEQKKNFLKFLDEKKIDYIELMYDDENLCEFEHIIKNIKKSQIEESQIKKYIVLSITDFKKALVIKENDIRKYFLKLEELFYSYSKYIDEYNLKLKLNELEKSKSKEIEKIKEELKENKRINANIKNFLNNVKDKNKTYFIYIATSTYFANLNTFKVGICSNVSTFLTEYNHKNKYSKNSNYTFYYCYIEKVYNNNEVEHIISDLLSDFRDRENKDLHIIHYTYLETLIKLVIKNINEPYNFTNHLIKNKLLNMYSMKPFIPPKILINDEDFKNKNF